MRWSSSPTISIAPDEAAPQTWRETSAWWHAGMGPASSEPARPEQNAGEGSDESVVTSEPPLSNQRETLFVSTQRNGPHTPRSKRSSGPGQGFGAGSATSS